MYVYKLKLEQPRILLRVESDGISIRETSSRGEKQILVLE